MMKIIIFVVILLSSLLSLSQGAVIVLNRDNFNRTEKGYWLVEFYAPWCQHCKKLAPVWEEVAYYYSKSENFDDSSNKIRVAKIDCEANSDVCNKEGATGFPTIKYYVNGLQKNYIGGRKKTDFLNFIHKMNKPITIDMKKENVPNAFKQEIPSFILVGENPSSKLVEIYTLVARHLQELVSPEFYFLKDKSIAKEFLSDVNENSIVVFREGDRKVYNGKIEFESLLEWARDNRFPYLSKYSEATYDSLVDSGKLLVMCVTDTISVEQEKFSQDCKIVAKQRAEDKRYLFGGLDALSYDRYASSFGATSDILPTVVVIDDSNEIHYIQPETRYSSPQVIDKFLQDIEAGNVKSQTWSYVAWISKKLNKFGKLVWQYTLDNLVVVVSSSVLFVLLIVFKCCLPSNNNRDKRE